MLTSYCTPGDGECDLPSGPSNPDSSDKDKDDIAIPKRLKALRKQINCLILESIFMIAATCW